MKLRGGQAATASGGGVRIVADRPLPPLTSGTGERVDASLVRSSIMGSDSISQGASAPQIRVVIVDDHEVVALGLRALLEDEADISVVAMESTAANAVVAATKYSPEVILMDYRLPDGNGVEATSAIRQIENGPRVVMITAVADRRVLGQALDAGCTGFVSKNADRADLVGAVRAAAENDAYFTHDMLKHLVSLRRFEQVDGGALTDRECEVLQLTADGGSPAEIASELHLSAHTVKNHLRNAMAKLDAHTKLDAVIKAARARVISIDG